jgi:bifunctional non-homologous end joining protein LigD
MPGKSTPHFIKPMLLKLVPRLPVGKQWQYEIKWDGYRGLASIRTGNARLYSRNQKDLSLRFLQLVDALGKLKAITALIDGEIVVLDETGKPNFQALQYFDPAKEGNLFFYAFDLLELNGDDLKAQPLVKRREQLEKLLINAPQPIRFSSVFDAPPDELTTLAKERGLEGIVAKDRTSAYEPGKRTGKWQKFKLNQEAELLIGGYIPDGKQGVESVILGIQEGKKFRYVACLDVRMPREASRATAAVLEKIEIKVCPFPEIPTRKPGNSWSGGMTEQQKAAAIWIKPQYKAEVTFLEWTKRGFLRHAQIKRVLIDLR